VRRPRSLLSRRPDVATLRAAWWAHRAIRAARRSLRTGGLAMTSLAPPPRLPDHARRGVAAVLHRTGASCLERSMVIQAWDTAHGRRRDLVVGVTAPSEGFRAHAWLDGDPASSSAGFRELFRRSAS
jgi:transglutaminase superfamily protein